MPILLFLACAKSPEVPSATEVAPAAPAQAAVPASDALARANAAADKLGTTLKGRLVAVMSSEGPLAAVQVCAGEAQALTAAVAAETGVAVGRSSTRLRNTSNAPPEWVGTWLAEHPTAEDATPVQWTEGGAARVLRPIAIEAPCLQCHGPKESLAPGVGAILDERYPNDQATGYALGELRGALWAEVKP
jgi:hypothetical protein